MRSLNGLRGPLVYCLFGIKKNDLCSGQVCEKNYGDGNLPHDPQINKASRLLRPLLHPNVSVDDLILIRIYPRNSLLSTYCPSSRFRSRCLGFDSLIHLMRGRCRLLLGPVFVTPIRCKVLGTEWVLLLNALRMLRMRFVKKLRGLILTFLFRFGDWLSGLWFVDFVYKRIFIYYRIVSNNLV